MSLNCKNVEDYVTLYKDGVLSKETEIEVTEHLKECENCSKYYKEYDNMNTSTPKLKIVEPKEANFAEVAKKIHKSKRNFNLLSAIGLATVISATVYVSHLFFKKD